MIQKTRITKPDSWKSGTSITITTSNKTDMDLEAIKEAGINCIELAWNNKDVNIFEPKNNRYFAHLVQQARCLGIQVWTIHLPFGSEWDISVMDEQERQSIIQKHLQLLQFASEWGIHMAVIHPSFEAILDEERKERIRCCKDALMILSEQAQQMDIQIAVECLPRTCLGNKSSEMEELIEGNELVGICCDVNHLLYEKPEHFIQKLGSRIITVHISDYDGIDEKHWEPGEGINDWNKIISVLVEKGYGGPFMFEVSNPEPLQLTQCWHRLLNDYEKKSETEWT
ncbi:sugar phosphate isomerase/epimerase family protein [Bacillus sp. FSL K6-3431]|uniref:sugar phosphate isomerase/epimerase family protein n=1 Tax=Bacillus sp. FSL K6-3431 TaxID=2921500 RepID=UPI0030FA715A